MGNPLFFQNVMIFLKKINSAVIKTSSEILLESPIKIYSFDV